MMGGGGDPSDFFGSDILAKSDIFWVAKNKQMDFFGLINSEVVIFWV